MRRFPCRAPEARRWRDCGVSGVALCLTCGACRSLLPPEPLNLVRWLHEPH